MLVVYLSYQLRWRRDGTWNPYSHCDDHGVPMTMPTMAGSFMAQRSVSQNTSSTPLSSWHHSETNSVLQPNGAVENTFVDASQGTDKQFYGRAFHLEIPQHCRKHKNGQHIHFLRQFQVDEFLETLSYHEILGFLPKDPSGDSYIFAIREVNTFRRLYGIPECYWMKDGPA